MKGSECTEVINKLGNIARENLEPAIRIDHCTKRIEGKNLLFVYIAESENKPVHLRGATIYESYTRSAGQTRRMSKQEVANLISSSNNLNFEARFASGALEATEVLAKLEFSNYFRLLKKPVPKTPLHIMEALAADRLVKEAGEKWRITNLGAILFANNIEEFNELRRKTIRVIVYGGRDKLKRVREVDGRKGYAAGFEGLIAHINSILPSNEVIRRALRKEHRTYPELAIRELVANALIHQDFDLTGSGPTIEIFSDRLEIRNPGRPLVRTERLLDLPPRSRNEALASLARRLGICEESGTGIDKVVSECEHYELPAPSFTINDEHFTATLYSPRPLTKMAKADRIRACYLHASLRWVSQEPITNESIRKRFNIADKNYPIASKIISETLGAKYIQPRFPDSKSKKLAQYIPFWA